MKRRFGLLCALMLLLLPVCASAGGSISASQKAAPVVGGSLFGDRAPAVDLSGMTLEELAKLQQQVTMAMWETEEWEEVVVPQGLYQIGADIPAGHWTVKAAENAFCYVTYGRTLDESGGDIAYDKSLLYEMIVSPTWSGYKENQNRIEYDIDMKAGMYVLIDGGVSVFAPYTGRQLEFKAFSDKD